jgi:hypothetical protein
VLPDGVRVGTDNQVVPFQFSASGASVPALALVDSPTAQV